MHWAPFTEVYDRVLQHIITKHNDVVYIVYSVADKDVNSKKCYYTTE